MPFITMSLLDALRGSEIATSAPGVRLRLIFVSIVSLSSCSCGRRIHKVDAQSVSLSEATRPASVFLLTPPCSSAHTRPESGTTRIPRVAYFQSRHCTRSVLDSHRQAPPPPPRRPLSAAFGLSVEEDAVFFFGRSIAGGELTYCTEAYNIYCRVVI